MKYVELTVRTTSEASELVADALWNYTDGGVAVSDIADVIALQEGKTGVFWDYLDESLREARADVLVKAFFPLGEEEKISAVMRELHEMAERAAGEIKFGTLEGTKREIEGDDWIDIWRKHFRPIHLGKIVVVPEWIEYEKKEGEQIVLLDSNMAFGTGEHETTSMCVELMQEYLKEEDAVLDVGCGSGILGIVAAKLGAKLCHLTDIDPIAVESATHNAIKNGVADKLVVTETNLVDGFDVKADLLLANITAEILVMLAPAIPAHLEKGGTVILSGIILDRLEKVVAAFAEQGLKVMQQKQKGEWLALVLKEE